MWYLKEKITRCGLYKNEKGGKPCSTLNTNGEIASNTLYLLKPVTTLQLRCSFFKNSLVQLMCAFSNLENIAVYQIDLYFWQLFSINVVQHSLKILRH